jgi:hypothetical protein
LSRRAGSCLAVMSGVSVFEGAATRGSIRLAVGG